MTANDKYISWLNSEALDAETRKELEAIKKAIESDKPQIDMSKEGEGKTVKLDIYYSPKWGKSYIQLFEYIPYTYEPVTEIKGFNIDKIEKIIK